MTDTLTLLLAALTAPLAFAGLSLLAGRRLRSRSAYVALLGALISLGSLLGAASQADWGRQSVLVGMPWIPSLGLNLAFRLDGLSVFFALVVSGMGCLVLWYSRHYLDDHARHHGRFYAFLLIFMAAMLGTVLSDDLLLLFVFWELTGISSFLLIGFNAGTSSEAAYGARRALLVTLSTGLALLAGVLILRLQLGTTSVSGILLAQSLGAAASPAALPSGGLILVLLLVGAFGKSAQVPFQFWLPGAMAAPTPVSAYLHSATLVKLGVFLAGRLYPLFVSHPLWSPLLLSVGGLSLVVGGLYAVLSHDIKAVLAYTTVAQLGALLLWYGLAPLAAVPAVESLALLHILSHVLYKGSLFMQAGILDHVTGTRDLRKMGGLRTALPLTFVAAVLTTASMAGLPGSLGFVSKELYLEAALKLVEEGQAQGWLILAALLTGALCFATVAWRLATDPWLGKVPRALQHHLHHAAIGFQTPPLLLALSIPVLGCLPGLTWTALAPMGGSGREAIHVSAFHGLNPAFLLTLSCLAGGIVLSRALYGGKLALGLPKLLDWGPAVDQGLVLLVKLAKRSSTLIRVDKPIDYLSVVIGACAVFLGGALWLLLPFWPQAAVANPTLLEGVVLALMAGSGLGVVFLEQWTTRLLSLGIVGFLVCFYFMLNKAPDLALTQMLIESATLVLLLLLLGRFPQGAQADEAKDRGRSLRKGVAVVISAAVGLIVFLFMLHITALPHPRPMGIEFLKQTLPLALGSNAVNTVLVDFRGFDTMFEITVLCIAALGCLGLLMRWKEKDGGQS